jgi:hypothetical protein
MFVSTVFATKAGMASGNLHLDYASARQPDRAVFPADAVLLSAGGAALSAIVSVLSSYTLMTSFGDCGNGRSQPAVGLVLVAPTLLIFPMIGWYRTFRLRTLGAVCRGCFLAGLAAWAASLGIFFL